MAATDKNYRPLTALHAVFGVTCVLMLLSTVAMFSQDYFQQWKRDQQLMRTTASAVAQRQALNRLPEDLVAKISTAEQEVEEANKQVNETNRDAIPDAQ